MRFFGLNTLAYVPHRDLTAMLGGSHAIQWFHATVTTAAFFFAWIILPETHGKDLSTIEDLFKSKSVVGQSTGVINFSYKDAEKPKESETPKE